MKHGVLVFGTWSGGYQFGIRFGTHWAGLLVNLRIGF